MSPTRTDATGSSTSSSPRRTLATWGASDSSCLTARRARAMLHPSSHCAIPNSQTTAAASSHSPRIIAPMTAMTISTLMSSARARTERRARPAGTGIDSAIEAVKEATANGVWPRASNSAPSAISRPPAMTGTLPVQRRCAAVSARTAASSGAQAPPQQASVIVLPRRAGGCRARGQAHGDRRASRRPDGPCAAPGRDARRAAGATDVRRRTR